MEDAKSFTWRKDYISKSLAIYQIVCLLLCLKLKWEVAISNLDSSKVIITFWYKTYIKIT